MAVFSAPQISTDFTELRLSNGIIAFLFGMMLSMFAWIINQGWTVLSLALFGPFKWTATSALKHILFCIVGAISTSIAWCYVFKTLFPENGEYNCQEEGDLNLQSYKREVADALTDLGELGFVVGYLSSQYIGVYFLNSSGYIDIQTNGISSIMIVLLFIWIILSNFKYYNKATKRAKAFENANLIAREAYYVQMA